MIKQKIEQIKQFEARNGRFSGIIMIGPTHEFSGQIDIRTLSRIEITYEPNYDDELDRNAPKKLIERSRKTGVELIVSDIIAHEINHRGYDNCNGCPGKGGEEGFKIYLDSFIEPMAKVLYPQGYSFNDVHNFTNYLEDLIENTELRFSAGRNNNGLSLFYENSCNENGLPSYFDAFLRTQMIAWGSSEQARMLFAYSTKEKDQREKIFQVRNAFLKRIGYEGKVRADLPKILLNQENWHEIARIFAEEFSKLFKPGMTFLPVIGSKRFEREFKDKDVIARYIFGRYKSNNKLPIFLPPEDSLVLLYEQLAKKLEIKVESRTVSDQMPLIHYGKRELHPDEKPRRIKFSINQEGDLEIRTTKFSIDYPIAVKENPKGFPEFKVALIDASESTKHSPSCLGCSNYSCSGSKETIPWGDKSIYHYENLAIFGILEFLKQNNLLRRQTFRASTFSSGFSHAGNLEDSKKLLMQPEFQGTALYKDGIDSIFSGSGNLVYTMSDGEVWNWTHNLTDSEKNPEQKAKAKKLTSEYFVEKARNHIYFHLHFGNANSFTQTLESSGFPVFYMTNGDEFIRKAIDLTRRLYTK